MRLAADNKISRAGHRQRSLSRLQPTEPISQPPPTAVRVTQPAALVGDRKRIQRLTLDQGMLSYEDTQQGTSITADVATDDSGVIFNAAGTYWGMRSVASGHGGPVLSLRDESAPYPLKVEVKIGDTYFACQPAVKEADQGGTLVMADYATLMVEAGRVVVVI